MRLLVFGQTGQVARELAELEASGVACRFVSREAADLSSPGAAASVIAACDADAVVNAAAFTAVDAAEEEEPLAQRVNGDAPGEMARACAARALPFVHLSTDYVLDGSGTDPHPPEAPVAPLNAYGRSKLAGERAVRAAGGVQAILRTSWVFSAHGANFVTSMLRLGRERESLGVVDDQHGGPTAAADIAAACVTIARGLRARPDLSGTYHYAGAPDASWADFAEEIFRQADVDCTVTRIATEAFPRPARRPLNSRLDCGATETAFGLGRPDWRASLTTVLGSLNSRT